MTCLPYLLQCFYQGGKICNVQAEVVRGLHLRCAECGQRGASVGCSAEECPKTFHLPCAERAFCFFDRINFRIFCLEHFLARRLNALPPLPVVAKTSGRRRGGKSAPLRSSVLPPYTRMTLRQHASLRSDCGKTDEATVADSVGVEVVTDPPPARSTAVMGSSCLSVVEAATESAAVVVEAEQIVAGASLGKVEARLATEMETQTEECKDEIETKAELMTTDIKTQSSEKTERVAILPLLTKEEERQRTEYLSTVPRPHEVCARASTSQLWQLLATQRMRDRQLCGMPVRFGGSGYRSAPASSTSDTVACTQHRVTPQEPPNDVEMAYHDLYGDAQYMDSTRKERAERDRERQRYVVKRRRMEEQSRHFTPYHHRQAAALAVGGADGSGNREEDMHVRPSLRSQEHSVSADKEERNVVGWDSVAGLDHHIRLLKESVMLPLLYPELFTHFGIEPPRGVLLHGPPGTGKTLLVV